MPLCARCAVRCLSRRFLPGFGTPPIRYLSRDTSEEVPTSFSADLEENKTSVNIINDDKTMLFFERFGRYGFKLSTGAYVLGPVLAFPKSVYSWRVKSTADINPVSLAALRVIHPRPDIFILGKGDPVAKGLDMDSLTAFFREIRVGWEILPTEEALSTFNFLNSERRYVAGAFLPPSMRDMYKEELAALEVAKRIRGFHLADRTGGTYGGEVAAGSIDELPTLPKSQEKAKGTVGNIFTTGGAEAAAARRARSDGLRERIADAKQRVKQLEDRPDGERNAEGPAKQM